MPIPNYLRNIAYSEQSENKFTSFDLKCKCGSVLFDIYENHLTKEEKELCKPYFKALDHAVSGGYSSFATMDDEGKTHYWINLSHSVNGPKEEVFIPPAPTCAHIHSIKIKCSECGSEYIIFDNRYHGYDGKFCREISYEEKNYIPHYKKKRRRDDLPVRICIKVEHDLDIDEFEENTDINCSFEEYTEAFTWLVIYTIDSSGKKRKIVDLETG